MRSLGVPAPFARCAGWPDSASPMVGRDAELAQLVATLGAGARRHRPDGPRRGRAGHRQEPPAQRAALGRGSRRLRLGRGPHRQLRPEPAAAPRDRPGTRPDGSARTTRDRSPPDEAGDRLAAGSTTSGGDDPESSAPSSATSCRCRSTRAAPSGSLTWSPARCSCEYTEAISALIAGLAQSQPLVIVCDDVHWADDASVDLLLPLVAAVAAHCRCCGCSRVAPSMRSRAGVSLANRPGDVRRRPGRPSAAATGGG